MGRKRSITTGLKLTEAVELPPCKQLRKLIDDTPEHIKEVASAIGVTPAAIRQYLTAGTAPSLGNLCKIADYFGVSTDYLLGRSELPTHELEQTSFTTLGISERAARNLLFALSLPKCEGFMIDEVKTPLYGLNVLLGYSDLPHLLSAISQLVGTPAPQYKSMGEEFAALYNPPDTRRESKYRLRDELDKLLIYLDSLKFDGGADNGQH